MGNSPVGIRGCRPAFAFCVAARRLPVVLTVALAALLAPSTRGDILHLSDGGRVDGDILSQTNDEYRVKTIYGTVTVSKSRVERVEVAASAFQRYAEQKAKAADTPAGQTELGNWCDEAGLRADAKSHYRRAIELDADYEPARTALGQHKVDGRWVDAPAKTAAKPVMKPKEDADSKPAEDELVATTQVRWTNRIRAIRTTFLESPDPAAVSDGKRRIAEIRDPLAILPLVKVLSEGGALSRLLLVETLKRFSEDESTLNLAAMALLETDDDVRGAALTELVRRKDDRVLGQFRKALSTDNDQIVRRAALALGSLRAESAIPELIERLTVQRRKNIEVPVRQFFGAMADEFRPRGDYIQPGRRTKHQPTVGYGAAGGFVGSETEMQKRDVTVFRTDVQQALVAITGENFGFEADEWRKWYEEKKR